MLRNIINIILSVVAVALILLIIKTIKDPIDRQNEINSVETAVKAKLGDIKKAQMTYKDMNDSFATNFTDLINGIKNGQVTILKKLGGKSADTLDVVEIDTMYVDALTHTFDADYPIDYLGKVPPSNELDFIMKSSMINKNGIDLPVFEVKDPKPINPKNPLILGSLNDAIYTGNWK